MDVGLSNASPMVDDGLVSPGRGSLQRDASSRPVERRVIRSGQVNYNDLIESKRDYGMDRVANTISIAYGVTEQ
ncbi:hypothetical protein L6452_37913 [Arctium lappa]|uniref:Uncharacterized protein n=1 Tax=Arctium lappa TaxID=4217 RepID=A0ACB8Y8F1_ARCLA|nr:hypothetical protein L6452_37913 [Arctium lappa]